MDTGGRILQITKVPVLVAEDKRKDSQNVVPFPLLFCFFPQFTYTQFLAWCA